MAQIAQVAALIANTKRDPKKRSAAYEWDDFLLDTPGNSKEREKQREIREKKAKQERMTTALNYIKQFWSVPSGK